VFANDVTGERMDRSSLSLPGDQNQLIRAVARANPLTEVVLHSAVTMPWRERVAAIVEAWYPGQQSGRAIAKTLFGDVDPSGRLPMTFPRSDSQGPMANDPVRFPGEGNGNTVEFSEGLFVGYRWFDRFHQRPLFPFGPRAVAHDVVVRPPEAEEARLWALRGDGAGAQHRPARRSGRGPALPALPGRC
jgi:beta-glucosidase